MSEPPLPFGHAVGRGLYVLLKGLVARGHRVTAFAACSKREEMIQAGHLFPAPQYDLRCYAYPVRRGLAAKLLTLRRPYSYPFSRDLCAAVQNERNRQCDVLHLEGVWTGWVGQKYQLSKAVLNVHNLYDLDQEICSSQCWRERLLKIVRRRAERKLVRSYPTLLTLSPRLAGAVAAIAPKAVVHVVPLPLDLANYPFFEAEKRPVRPIISIIGSMNWYPSLSAAMRLLNRLWPVLKQRVPSAKLEVVGWNARQALAGYEKLQDVEIIENVPDTTPYFERSSILLYAPERGSGMKVKILEAFAYGIPVVTTTEGIEGLPAEDGIHAAVNDTDEGLVERAVALLNDRSRQERQRRAARKLIETQCSPDLVLDGIERCYSDLLARQAVFEPAL